MYGFGIDSDDPGTRLPDKAILIADLLSCLAVVSLGLLLRLFVCKTCLNALPFDSSFYPVDVMSDTAPSNSTFKRARTDAKSPKPLANVMIVIDDSDERGKDLQIILALIKAHEDSDCLTRNLQQQDLGIIDFLATKYWLKFQGLAEEWTKHDAWRVLQH